jgi:hypothetical protein
MTTCKNGHVGQRNKYGACKRCAADNARLYRQANPEKYRARDKRRYSGPRREKNLADARARHAANRDRNLAGFREYSKKNRAAISARQKEYNARPQVKALRRRLSGLPEPTRPMPEFCEAGCGRRAKHLDHCHETGIFRGWLCFDCNTSLGKFGDNLAGILRVVAYLLKPAG